MTVATKSTSTYQRLAKARLRAVQPDMMPYMAQSLMSLIAVETEQCIHAGQPTMGVDKRGRLYYHPKALEQWTLEESSAALLHEVMHVMLTHWKRSQLYLGKDPGEDKLLRWNYAADIAINPMLRDAKVPLPKGCLYPETFKLPGKLSSEQYYELLVDKNQPPQGGGGKGTCMPGGGSAADGEGKPWEQPGPAEGGPEELSERDQELIVRGVAKAVEEWERRAGRGSVPADLVRLAGAILRPKVDPWKELLAAVRYATTASSGFGDFTYKKEPRRKLDGGVRLPAHFRPLPHVLEIFDTSGSMGEKDLTKALQVNAQAMRHLPPECVRTVSADTELKTVQKYRKNADLSGGGGTSMKTAILQAMELRPRPQVIVVITDGDTDWPDCELRCRVVALLTRKSSCPVPGWIKKIVLEDEGDDE